MAFSDIIRKGVALLLIALVWMPAHSQEEKGKWARKLEDLQFKPSFALQLWASYTLGQDLYQEGEGAYAPVDNRLETQIRRTRLGFSIEPFSRFTTKFLASIDFIGRDVLSATVGGRNNGANPFFRLWQLSAQWQVFPDRKEAYLTAGYFLPQIGRESITGIFGSTGMEKVWTQNYLRRHFSGTGPGRAAGINLGGLVRAGSDNLHLEYNAGIFNPVFQSLDGNSTGINFSPMFAGKALIHLGDPESTVYSLGHATTVYSLGHKANYMSKRKGLTLGVQTTQQGNTDLFLASRMVGVDLLFNWKHINVDGEWSWLTRKGGIPSQDFVTNAVVGYIKASYNIHFPKRYMLEPVFMISTYRGEDTMQKQEQASEVGMPSGTDNVIDFGFNFYFHPKLKLSLHYTINDGALGEMPAGSPVNNYYFQGGAGSIRRGDWIGAGMLIGL